MKTKQFLVLLPFLLCFSSMHSQILEGHVYDKKTNQPLQAATVYLDGTTIGGATDENGYFKINGGGNTQSALVLSYMGYLTLRIDNPFQYKNIKTFMEEDSFSLDEVFIGKSMFSRKSMLKAFREQFLGMSQAGLSCKIENEDDINLFFDEKTNTLSATSRAPLKIINNRLGYEVFFELADFSVEYKQPKLGSEYVNKSSYAGTTFYKDISEKSSKTEKRRLDSYLGSSSHFMRTVASESWEKEKFKLYLDKFPVNPKQYFKVQDTLGVKKVTLIKEPTGKFPIYKQNTQIDLNNPEGEIAGYEDKKINFGILYDNKRQSAADFLEKEFIVDENGNYAPVYAVMFGGHIGFQKLGDLLPLDYYQTVKGLY